MPCDKKQSKVFCGQIAEKQAGLNTFFTQNFSNPLTFGFAFQISKRSLAYAVSQIDLIVGLFDWGAGHGAQMIGEKK